MKREQLDYLIRAAGEVSGSRRLIVLGSQAILGQHPNDAPARALLSREADLVPIDVPEAADTISGVLGELSTFDSTHGYHADGVDLQTSMLPSGWMERLISIENENTNGYVGLCLETHDLLLSKYYAGREKDHEFCSAVVRAGLVSPDVLILRMAGMEISKPDRLRIAARIKLDSKI